MRCALFLTAVVFVLGVSTGSRAQPGPVPGQSKLPPRSKGVFESGMGGPKICAIEMMPTTRVVYGSECKDFCRPYSSICDLVRSCFGKKRCGDCGGCADCGTIHTYNVLMKKVVPGPAIPVCRVKDLSALPPGMPGSLPMPTPIHP